MGKRERETERMSEYEKKGRNSECESMRERKKKTRWKRKEWKSGIGREKK